MDIRRVGPSEWERLRTIRLAALADTPDAFSSTIEREAAWAADRWQSWAAASQEGSRQATFIVENAGAWLGIATGAVHRSRPGAVLYSMWVHPGARGRGLGRRLVEAVVAWADSRDLPAISLWVTEANSAAESLYRALGFSSTGRRDGLAQEMTLHLRDMPAREDDGPLADFQLGLFAVLLPEPLAGIVDGLRRRFDPVSAAVAPPHVSVSQPLAVPMTPARAERVHAIAGQCPAVEVTYGPARSFQGTTVDYLAVEPEVAILAVREALHATGWFRLDLPHTDDFVPHITIREHPGAGRADATEIRTAIDAAVPSGTLTIASIVLLVPDASGRFEPGPRFLLGPAGAEAASSGRQAASGAT